MRSRNFIAKFCLALFVVAVSNACGGGGGGSGDKETAVRTLHGSVDGSPLVLYVDDLAVEESRFAQVGPYQPVDSGEHKLRLERANSPGVVLSEFNQTFEDETEYSLLVYGTVSGGAEAVAFITDQVEKPDEGFAFVRIYSAVDGESSVGLIADSGEKTEMTPLGRASSYVVVTSGGHKFSVVNKSGKVIDSLVLDVPDRSDVSVFATGSTELGIVFTPVILDVD